MADAKPIDEILKEVEPLESDKKIEALTNALKDYDHNVRYFRDEGKKAFEKRDEIKKESKAQIDALEEKIANYEKQIAEGKISSDLLSSKNAEIQNLKEKVETISNESKSQIETLRGENETFKKQNEELENSTKLEILDSITDNEVKESLKDLPLSLLRTQAKLWREKLSEKGGSFNSKHGKTKLDTANKVWDDFTFDERNKIKEETPEVYERLRKTRFQKK